MAREYLFDSALVKALIHLDLFRWNEKSTRKYPKLAKTSTSTLKMIL